MHENCVHWLVVARACCCVSFSVTLNLNFWKLKQALTLNLDLSDSARRAGPQVPGVLLSPSFPAGIRMQTAELLCMALHIGAGDEAQALTLAQQASSLWMSLLPQLLCQIGLPRETV